MWVLCTLTVIFTLEFTVNLQKKYKLALGISFSIVGFEANNIYEETS